MAADSAAARADAPRPSVRHKGPLYFTVSAVLPLMLPHPWDESRFRNAHISVDPSGPPACVKLVDYGIGQVVR